MQAFVMRLHDLLLPVVSHFLLLIISNSEMGNQALNSLALVSACYTLEAVDVLAQISSAHLLTLCQALDLRVIEIEGRNALPDATPYIGQASRRMYRFIRNDLRIPFLGEAQLASTEAATPGGVTPRGCTIHGSTSPSGLDACTMSCWTVCRRVCRKSS